MTPVNCPRSVTTLLNSGARVYMADFEDSTTPTWANVLHGQRNLRDAVRRKIDFTTPEGRKYALCDNPAVLCMRPRGLHLDEAHIEVDECGVRAEAGPMVRLDLYQVHGEVPDDGDPLPLEPLRIPVHQPPRFGHRSGYHVIVRAP